MSRDARDTRGQGQRHKRAYTIWKSFDTASPSPPALAPPPPRPPPRYSRRERKLWSLASTSLSSGMTGSSSEGPSSRKLRLRKEERPRR